MKRLVLLTTLALALCLGLSIDVFAAPVLQEYQGEIVAPSAGSTVRGQVVVGGTASHPDFWKYEIRVAPGQNPNLSDDQWYRVVVREQPVIGGQLAVWDTTVLPDGPYTVRLRVVRNDGNWQNFDVLPLYVSNQVVPTSTPLPPTPAPPSPTAPPTATPVLEPSPTIDLNTPTPLVSLTPNPVATLTPLAGQGPATLTPLPGTALLLTPLPTLAGASGEPSVTATPIVIDAPTIIVPPVAGVDSTESQTDTQGIAIGGDVGSPPPTSEPLLPEISGTFNSGVDLSTLASACFTGAAFTAGIFLLVGLLYLLKSLVRLVR